jgi:hypothetical protein
MASLQSDREYNIQLALEIAQNVNLATVSIECGIPKSTLQGRQDGRIDMRTAMEHRQKLTSLQEEDIVNLILYEEKAGRACIRQEVRQFANALIRENGGDEGVGVHWIYRFLGRHKDIKLKPLRQIEAAWACCVTEEGLNDFYA